VEGHREAIEPLRVHSIQIFYETDAPVG